MSNDEKGRVLSLVRGSLMTSGSFTMTWLLRVCLEVRIYGWRWMKIQRSPHALRRTLYEAHRSAQWPARTKGASQRAMAVPECALLVGGRGASPADARGDGRPP